MERETHRKIRIPFVTLIEAGYKDLEWLDTFIGPLMRADESVVYRAMDRNEIHVLTSDGRVAAVLAAFVSDGILAARKVYNLTEEE